MSLIFVFILVKRVTQPGLKKNPPIGNQQFVTGVPPGAIFFQPPKVRAQ